MYIITTPLENILFTPEWTPDSKGYYWVAANNTSFLTQRKRNLHQAPTSTLLQTSRSDPCSGTSRPVPKHTP